ncbi:MAG: hypothetical protein WD066_02005 [Planctomycetaceae bacterium]
MSDLDNLNSIAGQPLSEPLIRGILAQIDLDVVNLLRDGKLSALKYAVGGAGGHTTDRASNLKALLECRAHYEKLLESLPAWEQSHSQCDSEP